MKRILTAAAGLALALSALPAAAKGDAETGKQLFYTCTGCHGIADYKNAYPTYRVPKVGGQNEGYLIAALTGYKKGERRRGEESEGEKQEGSTRHDRRSPHLAGFRLER